MARKRHDRWRFEADPDIHHDGERGFDEIVVGDWLHIERMDNRVYWMRLGHAEADVTMDHAGNVSVRWRDE